MKSKDDEMKDIFLAEAVEQTDELNKLFTDLEKNHDNKQAINSIFRITHTLKANAAGMGFESIASMAHVMEDVFSIIKNGKLSLTTAIFNDLFKANDTLNEMIRAINEPGKKVKYLGIKTKLDVLLRTINQQNEQQETASDVKVENKEELINSIVAEDSTRKKSNAKNETEIHSDVAVAEIEEVQEKEEKIVFSDNIHIPIKKLDNLLNLVGELMIERDRVIAMSMESGKKKQNEFTRLQRITSELQYSVMDVRLVQIQVLFNKFHRIVRDVSSIENKQVNLILEGTDIEIDRNILQIISDSLIHVVRNAVSHGIEEPSVRMKNHKNSIGTITMRASTVKDSVKIDVIDDGKGIDPSIIKKKAIEKGIITSDYAKIMSDDEARMLVFEPGFSSAEKITAVSGRGVGMDVVKRAVESIGGSVIVESEVGKGSMISLLLPSSMAVKGALLFQCNDGDYAVPLSYTKAVVSVKKNELHQFGNNFVINYLEQNIPILFLNDLFKIAEINEKGIVSELSEHYKSLDESDKINMIIINVHNKDYGLIVDKLFQQKEIVEKKLHPPLETTPFISGATILGNGHVCLVIDPASIVNTISKNLRTTR